MSIDKGKKKKKGINELLAEATAENERARTYEQTIVSQITETPAEAAEETQSAPSAPAKSKLESETDELIGRYSARKPQTPLSSTAELREILAAQSATGDVLLPQQDKQKAPSRRAEELKELLVDAQTRTLTDASVAAAGGRKPDEQRFSEATGVPRAKPAVQESMFDLDTESASAQTREMPAARFDSDYASLSGRISSGELDLVGDSDAEDSSQVAMQADVEDLVVVDGTPAQEESEQKPEEGAPSGINEAFDMMRDKGEESEDDFDEALERIRSDTKRNKKRFKKAKPKEFEYVSREQNNDVRVMLKKAIRISGFKALLCALLAAAILFLELATADSLSYSEFIRQGRFGLLYILIDLQLLFFAALTQIKSLIHGFEGVLKRKPNTDTLLLVTVAATAIYSVIMMLTDPTSSSLRLYSLPAALACFCSAFSDYLSCRKNYHCFKVLANKHKKFASLELDGKAPEAVEFTKYLSESSTIYTVKRTEFCDGLFRRMRSRSRTEDVIGLIIPVILIVAVVLFGVLAALGKPLLDAYAASTLLILIASPLTAFFMVTLPVVRVNKIGKKTSSAFVGDTVAEEYADAGVLSFADTEVYPSKNISIISIKAYGRFRLDTIVPDMARAFTLIGGPLASVLRASVDGDVTPPENSRLIESAADGVCVSLGGTHISIGKRSYLRRYRIDAPVDNGDTAYEKKSGTVMYIAVGDTVAAKVYLRYTLNSRFNSLLRDMYRAGLCLGVKTLDPNITQEMLERDIGFKKCPITVIKASYIGEVAEEEERIDSGIFTNGSLHTFLKMFALCDKARHVIRSNVIITVTGVFMSFFAVCFFAVTGSVFELNSIYAALFQLVWLVTVWLMTHFFVN